MTDLIDKLEKMYQAPIKGEGEITKRFSCALHAQNFINKKKIYSVSKINT